jgi:hypothetical protein
LEHADGVAGGGRGLWTVRARLIELQEEAPMNWNIWVRQIHRWVAMVFTVLVLAIFAALGLGQEPAQWVYVLPLFPLALLMLTGLYLFVLPYAAKSRSAPTVERFGP